ncbi:MAG: tetratricopeptide repeat protein [Cyanobacteria bacterium P01_B01_bin.77]
MGRASIIEAYIQRLLAWKQPITPSILADIAADVGITKGELDAINLKVQTHLTRGNGYGETGDFDRAIDHLTQASALNPVNLDVLHSLAYLYNLRYNQDSNLDDQKQALSIAKRCVELNPQDKEALTLVSCLEGTVSSPKLSRQTKPNIFILIGFLENIFSLAKLSRRTKTKIAVLILFLQQPIHPPKKEWWTQAVTAVVAGGVATVGLSLTGVRLPILSSPVPETIVSAPVFDPGPNIPVRFNHPGLLIEPRLSRLGDYDGENYYKLHGIVINDSGQEVRKLNLKVELLDGDGVPLSTINQVAVTNDSIRPGDTESFNLFHKSTAALISVRVSVVDIEQVVEGKNQLSPPPDYDNGETFAPQGIKLVRRSRPPASVSE